MSQDIISKAAADFLRDNKPGRFWQERRKLERKAYQQKALQKLREECAQQPRKAEEPRYVYVVGSAGAPVKIGIAADVDKRLSRLQTGHPERLRVYFQAMVDRPRVIERACHERLNACRMSGEWFNCSPAQAAALVQQVIDDHSSA